MRILFILVLYYNDEEAERFFRDQLEKQSIPDFHVLLVNNGSKDPDRLKDRFTEFGNVEVIGTGDNLGYMGAATLAIDYFRSQHPGIKPIVILSNTDIEFTSERFLEQLLAKSGSFDVAGPSIRSTITNSELNPFARERYSRTKLTFLLLVYSFYPFYLFYQTLSLIKRKLFLSKPSKAVNDQHEEVYAIHGSFMVFSPSYFERGGDLNFGSFLYEEELFVAEKARLNGMRTIFIPSLQLLHREHATTGTYKLGKHIRWMKNSVQYILKTFYHDK